jgi:hypothetical protein
MLLLATSTRQFNGMGLFQQQKQKITKLHKIAAIFFYYLIFEKLLFMDGSQIGTVLINYFNLAESVGLH